MNDAPHTAVDFIIKNAPKYGKAKGHRIQIEEFRKSKKSLLMKDALLNGFEAANAQEREAYANSEYIDLISGLAVAVEEEETLKWQMEAAKMRVEIWRTEQANNRTIDRATQ
jgi:hypothetical protein